MEDLRLARKTEVRFLTRESGSLSLMLEWPHFPFLKSCFDNISDTFTPIGRLGFPLGFPEENFSPHWTDNMCWNALWRQFLLPCITSQNNNHYTSWVCWLHLCVCCMCVFSWSLWWLMAPCLHNKTSYNICGSKEYNICAINVSISILLMQPV